MTDQQNKIESTEINPHIYSQLIFDKDAKTFQQGQSFQQMAPGHLDIHIEKKEVGPLPLTLTKNQNESQIFVRAKSIKFLEGNLGVNLCDLGQTLLKHDTKSTKEKMR